MGVEIPKRGQIWEVNLDPAVGVEIKKRRPVVIISNNINNQYASTVTILPITDKGQKIYPFQVELSSKIKGLTKDSKIKCEQIRTVDKSRLENLVGAIPQEIVKQIERALLIHLGIDVLPF